MPCHVLKGLFHYMKGAKRDLLKLIPPETLPPVTICNNRESPKFPQNASFAPPDDDILASNLKRYYV